MNSQATLRKEVTNIIKTCFDPEIPVNVWDLGLIYGIYIDDQNSVTVTMTLTSPNCPAIDILPQEIEDKVASLSKVSSAVVELIWDPPWDKSMMTEEAKLDLDML